eukprot:scaffold18623_cov144-Isochrysis_galbana.AAC.2
MRPQIQSDVRKQADVPVELLGRMVGAGYHWFDMVRGRAVTIGPKRAAQVRAEAAPGPLAREIANPCARLCWVLPPSCGDISMFRPRAEKPLSLTAPDGRVVGRVGGPLHPELRSGARAVRNCHPAGRGRGAPSLLGLAAERPAEGALCPVCTAVIRPARPGWHAAGRRCGVRRNVGRIRLASRPRCVQGRARRDHAAR